MGDFFNGTFSITRRSNGNYLLAGYKGNEDLEESDGFLLEVDNSGNPVQGHSVGTNTNEFIKSVYKDGENFVLNLSNINGVVPSASLIPILVGIYSSFNKSWSKIYNYTCNGPLFEPLIVNKINNNYISNSCYEIVEIDSTGLIISRKPVVIGGLPYTFFSSFINDGKDIYYSGGDWNNTFMVVAKSDSTGYMGCTQINNPVFPCYLSDTISIQSHIIYADSFSVPDSASNVNIAWPSSTTHIDCMTTGIDDTSNGNSIPIKIFPNPAHSSINIELADFHYNSLSLRINDMFGRTILIRQVDKSMILELNNMFTAGIYLLTFYNSVENYNIKLVIN